MCTSFNMFQIRDNVGRARRIRRSPFHEMLSSLTNKISMRASPLDTTTEPARVPPPQGAATTESSPQPVQSTPQVDPSHEQDKSVSEPSSSNPLVKAFHSAISFFG